MAGAKAPAVFFGLGLRLRAQEGQYEAPRALTALGASTMQDVSDQKSVHGTTPLCCGDPTDLRSFSACGLSHSVRPAGSLASSSSRMISTVGGAERQPYHVALDTHHEHPPQLPALRAMTTASPPLVEEVYEQHAHVRTGSKATDVTTTAEDSSLRCTGRLFTISTDLRP